MLIWAIFGTQFFWVSDPSSRDVLGRPYTAGGGVTPWDPPPPPLPMFEADSQKFASAPSVPRGFKLQIFRLAFAGDHWGTLGGRSVPARPHLPPLPPLLIHPCLCRCPPSLPLAGMWICSCDPFAQTKKTATVLSKPWPSPLHSLP